MEILRSPRVRRRADAAPLRVLWITPLRALTARLDGAQKRVGDDPPSPVDLKATAGMHLELTRASIANTMVFGYLAARHAAGTGGADGG